MTTISTARAKELEQRLKVVESRDQREAIFQELSRFYAERLQVTAVRWAHTRNLPDPVNAGQKALASAFILIAKNLHSPRIRRDLEENSLDYVFKGKIWSELGHLNNRHFRHLKRTDQLFDDYDTVDRSQRSREDLLGIRDDLEECRKHIRTDSERKILDAGLLRGSGYRWSEAAHTVGWKGSAESLRVSFDRLKKKLRERLRTTGAHLHVDP